MACTTFHITLDDIKKKCVVDEKSGCWIWQGRTSGSNFYGALRFNGKHEVVHRVTLHLKTGVSLRQPKEVLFLHNRGCLSQLCCNPDHISLGSNSENQKGILKPWYNHPNKNKRTDNDHNTP